MSQKERDHNMHQQVSLLANVFRKYHWRKRDGGARFKHSMYHYTKTKYTLHFKKTRAKEYQVKMPCRGQCSHICKVKYFGKYVEIMQILYILFNKNNHILLLPFKRDCVLILYGPARKSRVIILSSLVWSCRTSMKLGLHGYGEKKICLNQLSMRWI